MCDDKCVMHAVETLLMGPTTQALQSGLKEILEEKKNFERRYEF
jgi:hypothetical protein